jgi:hypothetical protein
MLHPILDSYLNTSHTECVNYTQGFIFFLKSLVHFTVAKDVPQKGVEAKGQHPYVVFLSKLITTSKKQRHRAHCKNKLIPCKSKKEMHTQMQAKAACTACLIPCSVAHLSKRLQLQLEGNVQMLLTSTLAAIIHPQSSYCHLHCCPFL